MKWLRRRNFLWNHRFGIRTMELSVWRQFHDEFTICMMQTQTHIRIRTHFQSHKLNANDNLYMAYLSILPAVVHVHQYVKCWSNSNYWMRLRKRPADVPIDFTVNHKNFINNALRIIDAVYSHRTHAHNHSFLRYLDNVSLVFNCVWAHRCVKTNHFFRCKSV